MEASPDQPARPLSLLAEALARARAKAERQRRRLEPFHGLYIIADYLRPRFQVVAEARKLVTGLGPTERAWEILALAARVERKVRAVESELDSLLPLPRQEDLNAPLGGGRS